MQIEKIRLIGWICVSIFVLSILGLAIWNVHNQWMTDTDNMSYAKLTEQKTVTGLAIGAVVVMIILTALVLVLGLYDKIEDVYGT